MITDLPVSGYMKVASMPDTLIMWIYALIIKLWWNIPKDMPHQSMENYNARSRPSKIWFTFNVSLVATMMISGGDFTNTKYV